MVGCVNLALAKRQSPPKPVRSRIDDNLADGQFRVQSAAQTGKNNTTIDAPKCVLIEPTTGDANDPKIHVFR